jgi:hypothetical protein
LDGDDAGLCGSMANRCRTVQRAVDVADAFDEIRVAVGVYTGKAGTVANIDKTVTPLGGCDDAFTIREIGTYRSLMDAQRNARWPHRFTLFRRLWTGRSICFAYTWHHWLAF